MRAFVGYVMDINHIIFKSFGFRVSISLYEGSAHPGSLGVGDDLPPLRHQPDVDDARLVAAQHRCGSRGC